MPLDLELELLRAMYVLATRKHADVIALDELLEFLRARSPPSRLTSPLLAHLVTALAEVLAQGGFLERVSGGGYALTPHAVAELGRAPAFLGNESWSAGTSASELCLTGR